MLDGFIRKCLVIRMRREMNPTDAIDILTDLLILRGGQGFIRAENGPEFVAETVRGWPNDVRAKMAFIAANSQCYNKYYASFEGRCRENFHDGEIFQRFTR